MQEVLAVGLGEAPRQGVPQLAGDGGLHQLGVPAAAGGVVAQGANLARAGAADRGVPLAGGESRLADTHQRLGAAYHRPVGHLATLGLADGVALEVKGVGLAQAVGGGEAVEAALLGRPGVGRPCLAVAPQLLLSAGRPVVPAGVIAGLGIHLGEPRQHPAPVALGKGAAHAKLEELRVGQLGEGCIHPGAVLAHLAHQRVEDQVALDGLAMLGRDRQLRGDLAPGRQGLFGVGAHIAVQGGGEEGAAARTVGAQAAGHLGHRGEGLLHPVDGGEGALPAAAQQPSQVACQAALAGLPGEHLALPDLRLTDLATGAQGIEEGVTGVGLGAADPPQLTPALGGHGGIAVEQGGVVVAATRGALRLAVGHRQQVRATPGLAVLGDGLAAQPLGQGRVGVAVDEVEHLAGGDLGEAVAQAMVGYVAGQRVVADGGLVDRRPVAGPGGRQGLAHGAVIGLGGLGRPGQRQAGQGGDGQAAPGEQGGAQEHGEASSRTLRDASSSPRGGAVG